MIDTLKKFKYPIIIVIVIVIGFIAYTVYTNANTDTSSATALQKTSMDTNSASAVPNNELAKSFVDQLLTIQSIDLRVGIFSDPVFNALVDNHAVINPQPIGRPNPFSPIGKDVGPASSNYQDINGSIVNSSTGFAPDNSTETSSIFNNSTASTTSSSTKKGGASSKTQ